MLYQAGDIHNVLLWKMYLANHHPVTMTARLCRPLPVRLAMERGWAYYQLGIKSAW
jgi:hypothetical protein